MRIHYFTKTLFAFAAWLLLQNFNIYAPKRVECGKSKESAADNCNTQASKFVGTVPAEYRIKKVVLDAGHGGKDPGCLGANANEKHNTLAIVLRLGEYINHYFPDIEVIYTRDTDVFVELNERAAIANRNKADLFISIHCNAMSKSSTHGTETYVMGLHKAKHNLDVAIRENSAIYLEENYEKNYEGFDPSSPEAHIIGSVWQSAYLEQSILFAGYVQEHSAAEAGRENRGVKQAGFWVLRDAAMPAVLIETGYLTNPEEEVYLSSDEGREDMSRAIFKAFEAYKNQMEGSSARTVAAKEKPAPPKSAKTVAQKEEKPKAATGKAAATPEKKVVVAEKKGCRIWLLSWNKKMDRKSGQLGLIDKVTEEFIDGQYHYYTGAYTDCAEAERVLPEFKNLGFKLAKVVSQ